jgi:hypothetical protein
MSSTTDISGEGRCDARGLASYGIAFSCSLVMLMILFLDLCIPLGVAVGVLYVVPVLLSLWSGKKAFPFLVALIASGLIIGVFFFQTPVREMWKVYCNRGLSLFATWITAILCATRIKIVVEREKALRDREEALSNLKILKGLLPMCAACKKIRDDKGYWNEVADYISEHSEAEFTHGLCQECAERLYPQYFKKEQRKNDGK